MRQSVLFIFLLMVIISISCVRVQRKSSFLIQEGDDGCTNFDDENACKGRQTDNDGSWINRGFQTPARGSSLWNQKWQDYNVIVGYPKVSYSGDRKSAIVEIYTRVNPKYGSTELRYIFNGSSQTSPNYTVAAPKSLVNIKVQVWQSNKKIANLDLENLDFIWNHPQVNTSANFNKGQKGVIVQMFGWPYKDIEQECDMLAKAGYLGVKVFPPQQSILDFQHPQNGELNPWYWLYQPVSYKLYSRMGTPDQLRNMINTCRGKGIRVYADAVVNHMSGNGNDVFPSHCSGNNYWGAKNSSGGSPFWTQGFAFENWNVTGERPGMEMPAVPYGPLDFHCARALNSWTDGFILNYGWLVNLADLNTQTQYVRQRIADYFTDLLAIGFSGFRIDAAKHISPINLAQIFKKLKNNLGGSFPDDFITYLQVIIGGEKDLLMCQDNDYNYGGSFVNKMKAVGLSDNQILKIKIWQSDYPKQFPLCGWPIPSQRYAIQLDCHDDQFPGSSSRDMGDTGSVLVKQKNIQKHRNFQIQMMTRNDGNWQIKLMLSSYTFFDSIGAFSFPDGNSDCSRCTAPNCFTICKKNMPYSKAHRDDVCGYTCVENGEWKSGVYTRVHRDFKIIKALRQWMGLPSNVTPSDVGLPANCQ